jgi:hypothetical protein
MIDVKRVERKLAALLITEPTSSRSGSVDYKRKERELQKFKRQRPSQYRGRLHNLVQAIVAFDRDISNQAVASIDAFNADYRRKAAAKRARKKGSG